jgi:alpha-mannosidase
VLKNGTVFASLETVTELCSPVDQSFIATVRQITSVDRVQPRLNVKLIFENVKTRVKGNPWLSYFGCRFAWDNEAAAISRAVMGQVAGFRSERFESPDYVEISDASHRAVIATHGNSYHRRSGPRMLDSILMVEGELTNEFQFTIDFDQPFPLRTATDVLTPMIVSETSGRIPAAMSNSWILGLSARSIELVRVDFFPANAERADELLLLLSETDGQDVSCVVKTARKPQSAFLVNADRTEKSSLEITDQGVVVCFGAFQIKSILLIL